VLVVAALLSCTEPPGPCTGITSHTVSSGTQPTFTWTPTCGVSVVSVLESTVTQWSVASRDTNAIISPVRYGLRPATADTQYIAPASLVVGHRYRLELWSHPRMAAQGSVFLADSVSFVP
jgi:hypothetical protein